MKRRSVFYSVSVMLLLCAGVQSGYSQSIEVTDSICTVWNGQDCAGTSGQGCNSTTFSLKSAQSVRLCAYLECAEERDCPYCLSVAYIYRAMGTTMEACIHSDCDEDCTGECITVNLAAGNYVLYSCKLDCDGSCANCPTNCMAKARVYLFPEP